jgi:two-component system cell cycle sensor histidine kinase/response regulator CckA
MFDTDPAPPPSAPLRVLIVEDEQIVALDLEQTLRQLGYESSGIVGSYNDAIAHVERRVPDLALVDIRIRGKQDGIELASTLFDRYEIPVVFVTSHADGATLARATRTTPMGYLLKPWRGAEVKAAIEVGIVRHRSERAIRARERWLATIIGASPDPLFAIDKHRRVVFANAAAYAATALGDPLEGRTITAAFDLRDERGDEVLGSCVDAALEGERATMPARWLTLADGQARWLTLQAVPVLDGARVIGVVLSVRDLTEYENARRRAELNDRLAAVGTLAAGIGHEINSPLASIAANAGFLIELLGAAEAGEREQPSEGELREVASDIAQAASMIARVTHDLRVFAREPLEPKGLEDPLPAVQWALRMTSVLVRRNARLESELGPMPPVRLPAHRLTQLVTNLVMNASQSFDDETRATAHIAVRTFTDEQGRAVIEVRDNGRGMTDAVRRRAFEPYYSTRQDSGGTGLGLALCREFARSAGGDIEVESSPRVGSCFRVRLPGELAPTTAQER